MITAQPNPRLSILNQKYLALLGEIEQERHYRYPADLISQKIAVRNTIVEIQNSRLPKGQPGSARMEVNHSYAS